MASQYWETYREGRLKHWGFAHYEAKKLSKYPLSSPAIRAVVKDRKETMREARRARIPKIQVRSQLSAMYKAEGITTKKGFNADLLIAQYRRRPDVKQAIERYQVSQQRVAYIESGYKDRYRVLRDAGFTVEEARQLARMRDIDPEKRDHTFKSGPWQDMMARHQDRIKVRVKRIAKRYGLTFAQALREYNRIINKKVKSKHVSPWDWIKIEYRPRKQRDYRTYEAEQKLKKAQAL